HPPGWCTSHGSKIKPFQEKWKPVFRPELRTEKTNEERSCPTAIPLSLSVLPVLPWAAFRAILPALRLQTSVPRPFVAHLQERDLHRKRSKTPIRAAFCQPVRDRLLAVRLRSKPEYPFPLARRPSTRCAAPARSEERRVGKAGVNRWA